MRNLLPAFLGLLASQFVAAADLAPNHAAISRSSQDFLKQPEIPFKVLRRKDVDPCLKDRDIPRPGFAGGCFLRDRSRSTDLYEQLVFLQAIDDVKAVDSEVVQLFKHLKVGDSRKLTIMELRDGKWVRDTMTLTVGDRAQRVESILERRQDPADGSQRVTCTLSKPPFELYSLKDKAGHRLMLKATCKGDARMSVESLKVSLAGETFELNEGRPQDGAKAVAQGGGGEEVRLYDLSERPDLVAALQKTHETAQSLENQFTLRFQGKGQFVDRELLPCLPAARAIARDYYVQRFGGR